MSEEMTEFEKQLIYSAFWKHVNLAPREIEQLVGPVPPPAEPSSAEQTDAAPAEPEEDLTDAQRIGRHVIRLKRKKKEELSVEDYLQMRESVNHIRRHGDAPPADPAEREAWRYELMVRGFDPRKKKSG